jgi:hypothetical protein
VDYLFYISNQLSDVWVIFIAKLQILFQLEGDFDVSEQEINIEVSMARCVSFKLWKIEMDRGVLCQDYLHR